MWRARVGKLTHTDERQSHTLTLTDADSRRSPHQHTDTLGRQCDSAININVKGATTKRSSNMRRLVRKHTHTHTGTHKKDK